jgi:type IV secretion system protein VirB8
MANKAKPVSAEKSSQERYFAEAKSWESSRVHQLERSNRTAWTVAIAGGVIGLASVIAVAALTPFKETELRVIRVDNATGIVDVVNALKDGKENYGEAVNKYFIQWYVRYREGYSKDLAEEYYYATGLMSGSVEQQRYFEAFNPKNPRSPINVYGPYAKVKVSIKSTSFISPTVALVRYTKMIERGTDRPELSHWAATVTFRYTKAPMTERDREINPLGFQVVDYRNDPEAGNDAAGTSAPASTMESGAEITMAPGGRVSVPALAGAASGTGGTQVPPIR